MTMIISERKYIIKRLFIRNTVRIDALVNNICFEGCVNLNAKVTTHELEIGT